MPSLALNAGNDGTTAGLPQALDHTKGLVTVLKAW